MRGLSERLGELGQPLLPSGITKIEKQERRVSTAELVAIAVALEVSPVRLLLPVTDPRQEIAVTPNVVATQAQAWAWALAQSPLLSALPEEELDTRDPWALLDDFRRRSLPNYERLRSQHAAVQAANDVLHSIREVLNRAEHPEEYETEDRLRAKNPRTAATLGPDASTPAGLRARLNVLRAQVDALIGDHDGDR